jgi:hypothetical protein
MCICSYVGMYQQPDVHVHASAYSKLGLIAYLQVFQVFASLCL